MMSTYLIILILSTHVRSEIVLRILDVFSKPAIFLDWNSTVKLTVYLLLEHIETPVWTFEDSAIGRITLAHGPVLEMIVNETFRFGRYSVTCGSEVNVVEIPYRLVLFDKNSDLNCTDALRCAYNNELKYHSDRLSGKYTWCLHSAEKFGCTLDGVHFSTDHCKKLDESNLMNLMTRKLTGMCYSSVSGPGPLSVYLNSNVPIPVHALVDVTVDSDSFVVFCHAHLGPHRLTITISRDDNTKIVLHNMTRTKDDTRFTFKIDSIWEPHAIEIRRMDITVAYGTQYQERSVARTYFYLLKFEQPKAKLDFHSPTCILGSMKRMNVTCSFVHGSRFISSSVHMACEPKDTYSVANGIRGNFGPMPLTDECFCYLKARYNVQALLNSHRYKVGTGVKFRMLDHVVPFNCNASTLTSAPTSIRFLNPSTADSSYTTLANGSYRSTVTAAVIARQIPDWLLRHMDLATVSPTTSATTHLKINVGSEVMVFMIVCMVAIVLIAVLLGATAHLIQKRKMLRVQRRTSQIKSSGSKMLSRTVHNSSYCRPSSQRKQSSKDADRRYLFMSAARSRIQGPSSRSETARKQ